MRRIASIPARDTRHAVARGVLRVHWRNRQVPRVDRKRGAAESQRNARIRRARNREPALAVGLRARDALVHRGRVLLRREDERRARVEDRGAALQSGVRPTDGDRVHARLPETDLADVVDGDERRRVELSLVEPAEGDLAVVVVVGEARDLVGRDGVLDEAVRRQSFDRGRGLLLGERLRERKTNV